MLVLCGWEASRGAHGATVIECSSLKTLRDDFQQEMARRTQQWDAELEKTLNRDEGGVTDFQEPCWPRPAAAKMTWFYPQPRKPTI